MMAVFVNSLLCTPLQPIEDIRQATNKGMAIGNDKFKGGIEKLTGNNMKPKKMGRPYKAKN
ncbi:hypothetical protein [Shewanella youngdeokensis]|uniref:Transposase n=1 Tax=Shewanella youngdeokensis TaxID=2999068 RepID=A0ABZ0K389_9GAMM|nr:hypothetical protein RGE70_03300 [Shewanella sp. DAU334]